MYAYLSVSRGHGLKCITLYCRRKLMSATGGLSTAHRNSEISFRTPFPNQNLCKTFLVNERLGFFCARTFRSIDASPFNRYSAHHRKDGVSGDYELIHCTPKYYFFNVALGLIYASGVAIIFALYKTFLSDELLPLNMKTFGSFDNETMAGVQEDQLPYIIGMVFLMAMQFALVIFRLPLRIYRLESGKRQYLAVYANKLIPFAKVKHPFLTASRLSGSFLSHGLFFKNTYSLGSRKAILFPEHFRSAFDHDEMIDDPSYRSALPVKKIG